LSATGTYLGGCGSFSLARRLEEAQDDIEVFERVLHDTITERKNYQDACNTSRPDTYACSGNMRCSASGLDGDNSPTYKCGNCPSCDQGGHCEGGNKAASKADCTGLWNTVEARDLEASAASFLPLLTLAILLIH
jgi:hypothetical protein